VQNTGSQLAALTRKLLPESAALDFRLNLAAGTCLSAFADHSVLTTCQGWPAVRAVIQRAIREGRSTLVYGDYDVDGAVATFLLHRYLRSSDVPGNCFIPSRLKHGYGLDREVIEQAAAHGYQTLIAVDCGVANLEEVALAKASGLDVAIIDHHTCPEELPDAAVLNPHLEAELPPYCAAGLVFCVLHALRDEAGQLAEPDECELAALATLADIVPLEPHNWALAHHGMRGLAESPNRGLQQLIRVSHLHGLTRITARQVVFSLVPRLNAAGRIRNARIVLDLLGAETDDQALQLAVMLDGLNSERKQVADKVARAALLQAAQYEDQAGVALYAADWHIGVLGIAAARVAKLLDKPAIVLADSPLDADLLTGSARSNGTADIMELLRSCADTLNTFGGHGAAAGLALRREQLEAFRRAWAAAAEQSPVPEPADYSRLPRVSLHELTEQFEADIWRLSPFGASYPPPNCVLNDCTVARVSYMGQDKTHLNLVVTDGSRQVRLAGFNQSHLYNKLRVGTRVEPAVEIEADNYNNRYSILLRLTGLANQDAEQSR
jgi:single-stranded-DNA-specific exonuclease